MITGHKASLKKNKNTEYKSYDIWTFTQAVMWGINEKKTNAVSSFVWKF